jgi:hypothetical protein
MGGLLWMFVFLGLWIGTPFLGEGVIVFREFPGRVLISLPYEFSVFAGLSAVLFIAFSVAQYRGNAGRFSAINAWLKWLALLPAISLLGLPYAPQLGTLLLIFMVPGILASAAIRGFGSEFFGLQDRPSVDWTILLATGTILYCLLGVWVTKTVGEHGGDEGHYLVQAKSLHEDGDLDLRNNLGEITIEEARQSMHVSHLSKGGKWYSCHYSALCFLLAPTCGHGLYARHLVLGLIAGFGIAGVYLLARLVGASRRAGWAVAMLMGGSVFYGIYSCRALPEVLGGTLAVYGFAAILLQKRHPVSAMLLGIFCIGALPWAYIRFIPMAVTLAGAYALQCFCSPNLWRLRLFRLFVFVSSIVTLWTMFYLNLHRMYAGAMADPVHSVLMASPMGLWYILTSSKGILVAFPVFACALLGSIGLLQHSRYRVHALWALLFFLSIWLTSCSVTDWWGGGTLPGRFLLITVPILMGVLALALDMAPAGFRFVTFYLGLFSVNMFCYLLSIYPDVHGLFGPLIVGDFHFLLAPFPGFLVSPGDAFPWSVVGGAVLLAFLWLFPRVPSALCYAIIVLTAGLFFLNRTPPDDAHYSPLWTAQKWQRTLSRGAFMWACGDTSRPLALLDYSNLCSIGRWPRAVREVTGVPAQQVNSDGIVSYPLIPANGWDNHPEYRWATLLDPVPAGKHDYALRLQAEIPGDSDIELAIREGGRTCLLKTFKAGASIREEFAFSIGNKTRLYILMRFMDPAEKNRLVVNELTISAYESALARAGNLTVGEGIR